jgi:hypothetical protein
MKVKDLIAQLENLDPEAEVYRKHDTGNYWHDALAVDVRSVSEVGVSVSEYHRGSLKITDEPEKHVYIIE